MLNKPIPFRKSDNTPYLFLAPMEGVGDRSFRKAIASIGGFDEAVTEFMRVPSNAHVKSLAKAYQHDELNPIPIAAQIMGSDPNLMADMCVELQKRGAKRIDLNCGCPSNTVTGRGAGSSLLKDPNSIYEIARAMAAAVSIPVSLKMRIGYEDTSLFKENLFAAQESGVAFLTIHPRTKVDGYTPPAKWEYIAEAKSLLHIPIVGNGDILNVQDACRMLEQTKCDALMIGRGSVTNPFIFHEIHHHFKGEPYLPTLEKLQLFLNTYINDIPTAVPIRNNVNKLKQLMSFLFKKNETLLSKRQEILSLSSLDLSHFLKASTEYLLNHFI